MKPGGESFLFQEGAEIPNIYPLPKSSKNTHLHLTYCICLHEPKRFSLISKWQLPRKVMPVTGNKKATFGLHNQVVGWAKKLLTILIVRPQLDITYAILNSAWP
jgi:hypothetical protein